MQDIQDPLTWVFCFLAYTAARLDHQETRQQAAYGQIIIHLPAKELSIDESMIGFKGRLSFIIIHQSMVLSITGRHGISGIHSIPGIHMYVRTHVSSSIKMGTLLPTLEMTKIVFSERTFTNYVKRHTCET